jgi:hypothetical protein
MTPLQFKVTNKAEYDDLMQKCEQAGKIWSDGTKPTHWQPRSNKLPMYIEIDGNEIFWGRMNWINTEPPTWQLGQSLPLSTLEAFCAIPENEDGSITVPSTLAVGIVKELTR